MPARRGSVRPEWTPPSDTELVVLEGQIRAMVGNADEIRTKPLEQDGWEPWDSNLGDLIARAFGPNSAQANTFRGASFGGPNTTFMHPEQARVIRTNWRNRELDRSAAAARGALDAIALELERRRALPIEPSLPQREFASVQSVALRGITSRDYEELRRVASGTVKAMALLGGSVIEAVLYDALEQRGFTPQQLDAMKFIDLIDEAARATIIQPRTKSAAHAVRDTRNFVHPAVELREGRLRKVDADAAIALMAMVLEDVE